MTCGGVWVLLHKKRVEEAIQGRVVGEQKDCF